MTTRTARALTPDQVREVTALLPDSDSVELKVTVPDDDHRSVVEQLGMDVLKAQIRQVAYFDTPDLLLDRSGIVVRARRVQRRRGDSVVKLRPVAPAALTEELRRMPGFGVEVDAMPGGYVCSARMKAPVEDKLVRKVFRGDRAVGRAFTRQQRSFFEQRAPDGVSLDSLVVLGPLNILKLKFAPKGYAHPMVAELWFYPDGSRILELSAKFGPDEVFEAAEETAAFLSSRGVDLSAPQRTKTRAALEFLAARA
jgi:hypothetical protein